MVTRRWGGPFSDDAHVHVHVHAQAAAELLREGFDLKGTTNNFVNKTNRLGFLLRRVYKKNNVGHL